MGWRVGRRAAVMGCAAWLATSAAQAQYYAPDPPLPEIPWYEMLELHAFVDAYASVNYNFPRPQWGNETFRSFDATTGFALSWVGVDASFQPDPIGGTLSLRYGPSAEILADRCLHEDRQANPCDTDLGLHVLQQAFGSWAPGGAEGVLRLDFGKFDSIYGIERAEAHRNTNYTRGLLFSLAQPLFHTGLRAHLDLHRQLQLNFLAVNGQNATLDNNLGKTFGAQIVYLPGPALSIRLGWLGGPESDDTAFVTCPAGTSYAPDAAACTPDPSAVEARRYGLNRGGANDLSAWRHHGDLVVTHYPSSDVALALNAIAGTEGVRTSLATSEVERRSWFGGAGLVYLTPSPRWGIGLRGEYLYDRDGHLTGVPEAQLVSGTLTLDAHVTGWLQLRLDNRFDALVDAEGNRDVFPIGVTDANGPRDARAHQFTTTLGVIVYSG
ncbi:MAG: outer membrane beta-barrel protein [Myxococcales bacterium]|jgi:hypothetical protein|nr:outer membrane beta-barrel protein [Myxococcales bacterium]